MTFADVFGAIALTSCGLQSQNPIKLYVGEQHELTIDTDDYREVDIILAWSHIGRVTSLYELSSGITKLVSSIKFDIPEIPTAKVRNLHFSIRQATTFKVLQEHVWAVYETAL